MVDAMGLGVDGGGFAPELSVGLCGTEHAEPQFSTLRIRSHHFSDFTSFILFYEVMATLVIFLRGSKLFLSCSSPISVRV